MEENILKYFTGNGEPTTETIEPQNISLNSIECQKLTLNHSLNVNNKYYIRYGYSSTQRKEIIEIYNIESLENGNPLYTFDNIKIGQDYIHIRSLKQDEDGRFYALANTLTSTQIRYLVLFNNFIQDEELIIRKVYSQNSMNIDSQAVLEDVVKKNGSADYYFVERSVFINDVSGVKIYHFKIDITSGNTTETFSAQYNQNSFIRQPNVSYYSKNILDIIDNNIIYMFYAERFEVDVPYPQEYHKWIINDNSNTDTIYETEIIKQDQIQYYEGTNCVIEDSLFKNLIITPNNNDTYKIELNIIDLYGNSKIINIENSLNIESTNFNFIDNYLIISNGSIIKFYYYEFIDDFNAIKFYENNFDGAFGNLIILKNYNLLFFIGYKGAGQTSLSYSKNTYSLGYSSEPYYNNNFIIPQYLNLYSKNNDDTSIIFSRDVINRFYSGNQLTSTFNVPNYMLNTGEIKKESIYGQTNLVVESDNKNISKNRFESLYFNYIYSLYMNDNTNNDNMQNMAGQNRLANSLWNTLDYQDVALAKARVTHEDGSQAILNLNITNVSGNSHTFEYEVSGNINKIEYLSQDEKTVYATFRCNLEGTNTIEQTITVNS